MYRLNQKLYSIFITLLFLLALYNIFYELNSFPISSWDEARHGVNAYEMLKGGNYIVNTYLNKIDYWNLKPPLSFWANMAGYKLVGFNSLGLRLFSGVAAILTIILVALFVNKKYGKLASFISTLVLVTSPQFLTNHSARTGDADSLFVFFFTIAILSLLVSDKRLLWIYISGLAFSFAFLTKSWHAINIAVIIGLYLGLTGRYKKMTAHNWLLLFTFMVFPIFSWIAIRYQYDGFEFIRSMISYDLLKRSSNAIEGHIGGGFYYLGVIWRFFSFWLLLLSMLMFLLLNKDFISQLFRSKKKTHVIGICLWIIIPLLFFTFAKTKIRWYILPIYPPLSILIGVLASKAFHSIKSTTKALLAFSILLSFLLHEREIQTYLKHPPARLHLSLVRSIAEIDHFKGYSLFVHNPKSELKWTQNLVLTSKLFGDFLIEDGDINDFLHKENALLLIRRGFDSEDIIKKNQLTIIAANRWGYIVEKSLYEAKNQDDIAFY